MRMANMLPQQCAAVLFRLTDGRTGDDLQAAIAEFARFLRKRRMTKKLPHIIVAYEREVLKANGETALEITSAKKLSENLQKEIEQQFGAKRSSVLHVDEQMIAGIKIKMENTILDGSLPTQLEKLKRHLL